MLAIPARRPPPELEDPPDLDLLESSFFGSSFFGCFSAALVFFGASDEVDLEALASELEFEELFESEPFDEDEELDSSLDSDSHSSSSSSWLLLFDLEESFGEESSDLLELALALDLVAVTTFEVWSSFLESDSDESLFEEEGVDDPLPELPSEKYPDSTPPWDLENES